jgi:hypothetical protein
VNSVFTKCIYVGYTDATFQKKTPRDGDYLGLLGPAIHAEVPPAQPCPPLAPAQRCRHECDTSHGCHAALPCVLIAYTVIADSELHTRC